MQETNKFQGKNNHRTWRNIIKQKYSSICKVLEEAANYHKYSCELQGLFCSFFENGKISQSELHAAESLLAKHEDFIFNTIAKSKKIKIFDTAGKASEMNGERYNDAIVAR